MILNVLNGRNYRARITAILKPKYVNRYKHFAKNAYLGLPISNGRLFDVDRHFVRRKRRASGERRRIAGVRGIARDCGIACHLRLRSIDLVYPKHSHKFSHRSLPVVENADVVPLVQYLDSDSSARARLSRAASDCIYRARVVDAEDSSIVNLCDSDNGLVSYWLKLDY
ncbi:unnamed protein product [Strongylus vulgaris]|uniref:Uncharacterized protein n=1 Tax=Strongylus vulgaris TaxID=40348 RepID=A0A3P7JLX4_STRVU|nr:unnamed protein product [Strongylus vulgaris]